MTKVSIKRSFTGRLVELVSHRKTETVIMLMIAGFLACLGFLLGNTHQNPNYELMFGFMNHYVWAGLFFIYAGIKAVSLFVRTNFYLRLANGILGLWAWMYIFLSFTVFDKTPMAPTEMLLLMPVIIQSWLVLSTIHWNTQKNNRGKL